MEKIKIIKSRRYSKSLIELIYLMKANKDQKK